MTTFTCKNCGSTFAIKVGSTDKSVECEICHHVISVPIQVGTPPGLCREITYKSDGVTPDFDRIFDALAKYEREAPPAF